MNVAIGDGSRPASRSRTRSTRSPGTRLSDHPGC
ncbi:MAG: hypothetical protein U0835_04595 [Isosphaeraceae bacterium]